MGTLLMLRIGDARELMDAAHPFVPALHLLVLVSASPSGAPPVIEASTRSACSVCPLRLMTSVHCVPSIGLWPLRSHVLAFKFICEKEKP